MAIAYFPSLPNADTIELAFRTTQGDEMLLRLFVDTGFTGVSSFLLANSVNLATLPAPSIHAFGAIQGQRPRVFVNWRIPALSVQSAALAILSDLEPLGLPADTHGLAGLQFLRQFRRWGSERIESGWRFFLETEGP